MNAFLTDSRTRRRVNPKMNVRPAGARASGSRRGIVYLLSQPSKTNSLEDGFFLEAFLVHFHAFSCARRRCACDDVRGPPTSAPCNQAGDVTVEPRIHSRHHRAKVSRHATTVKMTKPIVMNPHLGCPSSAARQVAAESVMNTQTPRAVVIASALESIRKAICA